MPDRLSLFIAKRRLYPGYKLSGVR